jgi:hypothetical protein
MTFSHFRWDSRAAAVGEKITWAPFKARIRDPSGKKLSQQICTPMVP